MKLAANLAIFKSSSEPNIKMDNSKEIMSRLKFIGRIQKGEKINVRFMFVQPNSFLTSISRSVINPDNKDNTRAFVQNTVNRSFEIIELHSLSEKTFDKEMCKHFIADLNTARQGINNLKETYVNDVKFCCDMDTLMQEIDAKLQGINIETDVPKEIVDEKKVEQ